MIMTFLHFDGIAFTTFPLIFASVALVFYISIILGMNIVEYKKYKTKQSREIANAVVIIVSMIIAVIVNMVIFGVVTW